MSSNGGVPGIPSVTSHASSEHQLPTSKRSSEPPEALQFLVDRSLGRYDVADALRACGLIVHTLASIYGEERAQTVDDDEWLELAGKNDYVVLMKDNVARLEANRTALIAHGARTFCLTRRGLTGLEQAAIFVAQRHRIIQRARKPGPYVYGVYVGGLAAIWLPPSSD
jgi:hypothetical protein